MSPRHLELAAALQRAATYLPINRYLIQKEGFYCGTLKPRRDEMPVDQRVEAEPRWFDIDIEDLNLGDRVEQALHVVKNELSESTSDYEGWKIEIVEHPTVKVAGAMMYRREIAITPLMKLGRRV